MSAKRKQKIFYVFCGKSERESETSTCFPLACMAGVWGVLGARETRGSGRARRERKLQSIIKVSFWRLCNVYNQQDQTFVFNNLFVDKAQPAW